MKPYRVLVTGSRDWPKAEIVCLALDYAFCEAVNAGRLMTLAHGACPTGADAHAAHYANYMINRGLPLKVEAHPADWDHCVDACPQGHRKAKRPGDTVHPGVCTDYCPSAGPRRNRELVALGADLALAFIKNGSRGASHTALLAERSGIPVRRFAA